VETSPFQMSCVLPIQQAYDVFAQNAWQWTLFNVSLMAVVAFDLLTMTIVYFFEKRKDPSFTLLFDLDAVNGVDSSRFLVTTLYATLTFLIFLAMILYFMFSLLPTLLACVAMFRVLLELRQQRLRRATNVLYLLSFSLFAVYFVGIMYWGERLALPPMSIARCVEDQDLSDNLIGDLEAKSMARSALFPFGAAYFICLVLVEILVLASAVSRCCSQSGRACRCPHSRNTENREESSSVALEEDVLKGKEQKLNSETVYVVYDTDHKVVAQYPPMPVPHEIVFRK